MIFRRCFYAALKEMRHTILLVFAYLYILIGVSAKIVIPSAGHEVTPVTTTAMAIFYVIIPIIILVRVYFKWRDVGDEKYEITADGYLKTTYRTFGRFRSDRSIPIHLIQSGYPIQAGWMENMLNYGDVILQGGWAAREFVLKDVYRPHNVISIIMDAAHQHKETRYEDAVVADE